MRGFSPRQPDKARSPFSRLRATSPEIKLVLADVIAERGAVLDVALKSDHLEAQLTGQAAFPIFASAKDKFFYKVVDAQLDFERDGGGKVTAVVLRQNGRDMRAPRMTTQR
jgi:hypothetical protein